MMLGKLVVLSAVVLTCLSGCVLAPTVDSVRKAGLTESSREGLLPNELKRFHQDLFWGSYTEAMEYAVPEKATDLQERLQQAKNRGRVVDHKIEGLNFGENAFNADVDVVIQIHDRATNLVQNFRSHEHWVFSVAGGWKIDSMVELKRI